MRKKITALFLSFSLICANFASTTVVCAYDNENLNSTTVSEEAVIEEDSTSEISTETANDVQIVDVSDTQDTTELSTEVESTETVSEETTVEEVTTEEITSETEVTTEITTEEATEEKITETIDASTLTYRLIVGTPNKDILTNGYVISNLDDLYIVGYTTKEDRANGFTYYSECATFVENDDDIYELADPEYVATNSDADVKEEVTNADDSFTILDELEDTNIAEKDKVIAVIDTGVSDSILSNYSNNIVGNVSVIGDSSIDDNGHGSAMINFILEENPKAKILSIKAMDANGKGSATNIYSAIQYAIDNNVDIINLSLSAYYTADNSIVKDIIQEAVDKGIIVAGSAGNKSKDVKYFIPGCVEEAYVIGAISKTNDNILKTTNYGETIDYFVESNSSSEATARFSGMLSTNKSIDKLVEDEKILKIIEDSCENMFITDENIDWSNREEVEDFFNIDFAPDGPHDLAATSDGTNIYLWPRYMTFHFKVTSQHGKSAIGTRTLYHHNGGALTNHNDGFVQYYCGTYFTADIYAVSLYNDNGDKIASTGTENYSSIQEAFDAYETYLRTIPGYETVNFDMKVSNTVAFCCDSNLNNPPFNQQGTAILYLNANPSSGGNVTYNGGGYKLDVNHSGQSVGFATDVNVNAGDRHTTNITIKKELSEGGTVKELYKSTAGITYVLCDTTADRNPWAYFVLGSDGTVENIYTTGLPYETDASFNTCGIKTKRDITYDYENSYNNYANGAGTSFQSSQKYLQLYFKYDEHPDVMENDFVFIELSNDPNSQSYQKYTEPSTTLIGGRAFKGTQFNIGGMGYSMMQSQIPFTGGIGYSNYDIPSDLTEIPISEAMKNPTTHTIQEGDVNVCGTKLKVKRSSKPGYTGYGITTTESTDDAWVEVMATDTSPNSPTGVIQVLKVDAEGNCLGGAEYTLYASNGTTPVADASGQSTKTTSSANNNKGLVTFYGLPSGTYVVKETKAPAGYTMDETNTYTVNLNVDPKNYTMVSELYSMLNGAQTFVNLGPIFDYSYYRSTYSDLSTQSESFVRNHYMDIDSLNRTQQGIKQGRRASRTFDVRNYQFRYNPYGSVTFSPDNNVNSITTDNGTLYPSFIVNSALHNKYDGETNQGNWWMSSTGGLVWLLTATHYPLYGAPANYKTISDAEYASIPNNSILYSSGSATATYNSMAIIKDKDNKNPISIKKVTNNTQNKYLNSNYTMEGTKYAVFSRGSTAGTFRDSVKNNTTNAYKTDTDAKNAGAIAIIYVNAQGNTVASKSWVSSTVGSISDGKIYISANLVNNVPDLYFVEYSTGNGYRLNYNIINRNSISLVNNEYIVNTTDGISTDPLYIKLQKTVNDKTVVDSSIKLANAEYTMTQYLNLTDANAKRNVQNTWKYKTNDNGEIFIGGNTSTIPFSTTATYYDKFPLGIYILEETKAPNVNDVPTGLKLSNYYYRIEFYQDGTDSNVIEKIIKIDKISNQETVIYNYRKNINQSTNEIIYDNVEYTNTPNNEPRIWHSLGIIKDDPALITKFTAQGIATLEGAEYYIYTTDTTIFNNQNTYNGHTYTINNNQIYVDGSPLTITTDKYGFGQTPYLLPWVAPNIYYTIEHKAPIGYQLSNERYYFDSALQDATTGELRMRALHGVDVGAITIRQDSDNGNVDDEATRGDLEILKVDIDGYSYPYIPYLVSLVDENGDFVESHVILADKNGVTNTKTRGNKSALTVNTLDTYYNAETKVFDSEKFNNEILNSEENMERASKVNIWFGNIEDYVDKSYVNDDNGSLLYGSYVVQELSCSKNVGQDLLTGYASVSDSDHAETVKTDHIFVDLNVRIKSTAWDVTSDSSALTISDEAEIKDSLEFTHLKLNQQYRVTTEAINILKDGTKVSLGESEPYEFTPTRDDETNTCYSEFAVNFNIDTRTAEPGSIVMLVDKLEILQNDNWVLIATHNKDCDIEAQKLLVPDISTKADNNATKTRVGSLDPVTDVDDTISYSNLGNKSLYRIEIKIVDDNNNILKDVNGNDCVVTRGLYIDNRNASAKLVAGVINGPSTAEFKFSEVGISPFTVIGTPGKNAYVVEELYDTFNDSLIISHNTSLDEEDEIIRWVEISTIASSSTYKQGLIPNSTETTLIDKISYKNLAEDITVRVDGTVVEKESGEVVTTNSKTYDLTTTLGDNTKNIELSFTFDSTPYARKDLVVYEKIYMIVDGKDILIADHTDINDTKQTVRVPDIETTLNSVVEHKNYKVVKNYGHVSLIDYVNYYNLKPNETYTMTAVLYDKNGDGTEPVKDIYGNVVSKTVSFEVTENNTTGVVPVPLEFDCVPINTTWETDDGYVAFEELKGDDDLTYAVHNDIHDEGQTVYIPKFRTTALNSNGRKFVNAKPNQTITDKVELKNFAKAVEDGDEFTLVIEAHDAETGDALLDNDGKPFTNKKTFIWNGQTEESIDITIDATNLDGKTVVFYENLYYGSENQTEETELLRENTQDSIEQSIFIPGIHTTATDEESNTKMVVLSRKIVDEIALENILPNTDYIIETKLVDKATGEFIKDINGNDFVHTSQYSTKDKVSENGYSINDIESVTLDLSNVVDIEGKDIVVYEYMYFADDNTPYVSHEDINDDAQTIIVPIGHTTATDSITKDHVSYATKTVTIIDRFTFDKLLEDQEYIVRGILMDKETQKPIKVNGKTITSEATFTPNELEDKYVDVEFTFDASALDGTTVVVFEDLYLIQKTVDQETGDTTETKEIHTIEHHDYDDADQTVYIPHIGTTATDNETKDHIALADKAVINDVVAYDHLLPNKEYKISGVLMDKETGKPILDKNGKQIKSEDVFTPTKSSGTYTIIFTFDASTLAGKTVVVFEDVTYNKKTVAIHHEIDDEDQTIHFPSGHTDADDSKTKDGIGLASDKTTIYDYVFYENLLVGKKYKVTGVIMDKSTGKPLLDKNLKLITNTVEFTAEKAKGHVTVPFTFDATLLKGKSVVVFESVYYNDKLIFVHNDIDDENQTVKYPDVHTTAKDKADNDNVIDGTSTEQTIIDTVTYSNLIIGKKYTVTGKLVIKPTKAQLEDKNYKEEYVTDENGKPLEVSVTFTAKKANGTIEVPFTIDASKYAGKKLVAFESISYKDVEVGVHADIEDEEQTITVSLRLHVKIAKADKDNVKYFLKGAEITIFNADGTVAKDISGKECVGVTNENGEVDFTILYDENNTYYAQETKAPNGYHINNDKFEIHPSGDKESLGTDLIKISVLDSIIVIPPKKTPPKTNDMIPIATIIAISCLGLVGILVFKKKKKK